MPGLGSGQIEGNAAATIGATLHPQRKTPRAGSGSSLQARGNKDAHVIADIQLHLSGSRFCNSTCLQWAEGYKCREM